MNKPNTAFIGLGSNLENPKQQVHDALKTISAQKYNAITLLSWYQSQAIGPGNQPDYINGVIKIQTTLHPEDLLKQLQEIENQQGRQCVIRWGPRTLDLDLLLYENECIYTKNLAVTTPRNA